MHGFQTKGNSGPNESDNKTYESATVSIHFRKYSLKSYLQNNDTDNWQLRLNRESIDHIKESKSFFFVELLFFN